MKSGIILKIYSQWEACKWWII